VFIGALGKRELDDGKTVVPLNANETALVQAQVKSVVMKSIASGVALTIVVLLASKLMHA